jgi:hypothetical protein
MDATGNTTASSTAGMAARMNGYSTAARALLRPPRRTS